MAKLIQNKEDVTLALFMPNQLLYMDLTGMDRFQIESMEVMLQNAQSILKFGNDISDKGVFRIESSKLFDSITDISSRIKLKELENKLKKLISIPVRTFDKHSLTVFSLFPEIKVAFDKGYVEYTMSNHLIDSFNNKVSVIQPKNEKEKKSGNFTPMDLLKIKNMSLTDYTRNFFRSAMVSFTHMQKLKTAELEFSIDEFRAIMSIGTKYKRYSDLKEHVLDNISSELSEHGIYVEFSNKTFRKQTTYIISKFTITEEFEQLCEDMKNLANSKDKKDIEKKIKIPKETKIDKNVESKIENVEVKIKSQQEFADELKMRNSNIEYVHYEKDGAEFKLNEIINCSNKEGIIKLILETKDYQVYYQKFSNNVEQKYENNIVTEDNFKKGFRFRKIKEEEKIIF